LFYLFLQEQGRTTVRTDEKALGTIVFKKLNATRRVRSALAWERMKNNSPIYEADTLRTADSSEASVCFDDGTDLELYENSMLRLDSSGGVRTLEFLGGDISLSSSKGEGNADLSGLSAPGRGAKAGGTYSISVGGKTISLAENSRASLSRSGDKLSVDVAEGKAGLTRADGSSETIDSSGAVELDLATGATRAIVRSLVPLQPEQGAHLVSEGAGRAELAFSWKAEGMSSAELELSSSADFKTISGSANASASTALLEVEPGAWYWRLRGPDGSLSAVRRFDLYVEPAPAPILPEAGAELSYRKIRPDLRFSWTRAEAASAYIFEIARDRQFAKPLRRERAVMEGITVAALDEGTWYWRVSPVYAMTRLGGKTAAEIRSFEVRKRPEMLALKATLPAADSMFLVQETAEKGLSFSWQPNPEAAGYELALSPTKDMGAAAVRLESERAWASLSGTAASALAKPGAWYWSVRWKDDEGNLSPYSKPRQLSGVDGALAVKLSFPPEGYAIADSLVSSSRFAWKSKLQAKARFQLSSDPAFSAIEWEESAEAGTLIGRQWKTGTWYWRIETLNPDGTPFHHTEARMFRVVDPLPEPHLATPGPGGSFYLRAEDSYALTWDAVPAADYYQVNLSYLPEAGGELSRYSATLEDTKLELPLGAYPQGRYRLLLQAFGLDKPSSTRLIGYLGSAEFSFKLIARMSLSSPASGARVEGLDARRRGVRLEWKVPDRPESSELLVARDPAFRDIAQRGSASSGSFLAERLGAGDYYWTAKGKLYGFDVSAQTTGRFTVDPIPLLPPPALLEPANGIRFGPAELRGLSALALEWAPVAGATSYAFALYEGSAASPIVEAASLKDSAFELEDFGLLENGSYRWTVVARAYDAKGELEQDGRRAESGFRIELPALSPPAPKGKELYYGR
jgi:hypothetical protein